MSLSPLTFPVLDAIGMYYLFRWIASGGAYSGGKKLP